MDCSMPFLDGFSATCKIREIYTKNEIFRENQPQILALTGHTEQEYVEKAINSGMDKVL
jgi:CheY-like chemotaxis protein